MSSTLSISVSNELGNVQHGATNRDWKCSTVRTTVFEFLSLLPNKAL